MNCLRGFAGDERGVFLDKIYGLLQYFVHIHVIGWAATGLA